MNCQYIPLLGIYLKRNENTNYKRYMHPRAHSSLFIIAKTWEQPKYPSTDEWIKKMWYMYNGILLSHKKE